MLYCEANQAHDKTQFHAKLYRNSGLFGAFFTGNSSFLGEAKRKPGIHFGGFPKERQTQLKVFVRDLVWGGNKSKKNGPTPFCKV